MLPPLHSAGNKLFQSTFINIIVPGASLITTLEWALLNSTVALCGYYFAAFTIDKPWMGRRFMQAMVSDALWGRMSSQSCQQPLRRQPRSHLAPMLTCCLPPQGFAWMAVLFMICAGLYHTLITEQIHVFQFLYFFSSFWGQFGEWRACAVGWRQVAQRAGCSGWVVSCARSACRAALMRGV